MNGRELTELKKKVKRMEDAEWRGYLAAKVEDIQEELAQGKNEQAQTKKFLNKLAIQVAKMPAHCLQVDTVKAHDERIDELEKKDAANKAVKTLLLGAVGGVGGSGGVLVVLKWILNVL